MIIGRIVSGPAGRRVPPLRSAAVPSPDPTIVYTDGACSGNPGPGGWAWAVPRGAFASGFEPRSTNQRMEIRAAFEAVRAIEGQLDDRQRLDLRRPLFPRRMVEGMAEAGLVEQPTQAGGQSGSVGAVHRAGQPPWRCHLPMGQGPQRRPDERSGRRVGGRSRGAEEGARTVTVPPEVVLPPDTAQAPIGGRDQRLPAGTLCGVFGHRPTELGGYQPNPTEHAVRARLIEILRAEARDGPRPHRAVGASARCRVARGRGSPGARCPLDRRAALPESRIRLADRRARNASGGWRAAPIRCSPSSTRCRRPSSRPGPRCRAEMAGWARTSIKRSSCTTAVTRWWAAWSRSLEQKIGADVWTIDPVDC